MAPCINAVDPFPERITGAIPQANETAQSVPAFGPGTLGWRLAIRAIDYEPLVSNRVIERTQDELRHVDGCSAETKVYVGGVRQPSCGEVTACDTHLRFSQGLGSHV